MKKMQSTVEEVRYNNEALNSEEQVWFPNILRYLQNRGIGDGKHGELLRANPVVMSNFLPQEDASALLTYTLEHEADFIPASIISTVKDGADGKHDKQVGVRNNNVRRSLIVIDPAERYREMISRRINEVLPAVLSKLGIEPFPIKRREFQLTASNDGEFFKMHTDNVYANIEAKNRVLSYVYYFYSEPKAFSGGNLQVYDTIKVDNHVMAALNFQTIIPLQNQIVFFPSGWLHEVLPVHCPSQQFANSRFTFNGWLHQGAEENK